MRGREEEEGAGEERTAKDTLEKGQRNAASSEEQTTL